MPISYHSNLWVMKEREGGHFAHPNSYISLGTVEESWNWEALVCVCVCMFGEMVVITDW